MDNITKLLFIIVLCKTTNAFNSTDAPANKTKRTLSEIQTYGENKPVLVLIDNLSSPTSNIPIYTSKPFQFTGSASNYRPVFNPEPKQVAAQQVLYEYQQTPTNAVSNVHVNSLFQPYDDFRAQTEMNSLTTTENPIRQQIFIRNPVGNPPYLQSSETVASPVQHSSLVNHGQHFAHVQFPHHLTPQHVQTHHYIPGKYLYVNGKYILQPSNPTTNAPNSQAYAQNQQALYNANNNHKNNQYFQPVLRNPVNYANQVVPKQKLMPPPNLPPMSYSAFQPPSKHQIQQITKPILSDGNEEQEEEGDNIEEEEKAPVKEEEGDEDDEKSNYENEEDESGDGYEPESYFGKYSFDEEDSDDRDHEKYQQEEELDEDEDDDSHRGSSKYNVRTNSKRPAQSKKPKYDRSKNYKYSEGYSTSSKYENPSKTSRKSKSKKSKPTMKYKSIKYTRQNNGKPKIEKIEGRQSENVPVVEKHKVFQERWYVSKESEN